MDFDKHTRLTTKRDVEKRKAKQEKAKEKTKRKDEPVRAPKKLTARDIRRPPPSDTHKTLCLNCKEHKVRRFILSLVF